MTTFGRRSGAIVLVFAVGAAAYAVHRPALSTRALSFDDHDYLIENLLVRNPSWASAERFLGEVLEPSTVKGYYQPLAMMSLMFDCAAGGRPENLRPFRATSLALHVANTTLVILLLCLLFERLWAAALAGLLFGLHPVATESVPWLAERKTLLAAYFALLALCFYVDFARRRAWSSYLVSCIAFLLSVMSKPTGVLLPLALLILDWWPLRRLGGRTVLEKTPLLVAALLSAAVTAVSQERVGGAAMPGPQSLPNIGSTVAHNVVFYVRQLFWPVDFPGYYPFPEPFAPSHPAILAGLVGTLLLVLAVIASLRWTRAVAAGASIFLVLILPALGVIGFTNVIAANRFLYLPMIGLLLPVAWGLGRLLYERQSLGTVSPPRWPAVSAGVLILAAGTAFASRSALVHWQDSLSLFEHLASMAPNAPAVRYDLANALREVGRLDQAVAEYEAALRLKPEFPEAHNNLAAILTETGQIGVALAHYAEALRLDPRSARAHNNLGVVLAGLGRADEAVGHFREAVRLKPDFFDARFNLGQMLAGSGRHGEAVEHLGAAVALDPGDIEARLLLAASLEALGDWDNAAKQYQRILQLSPNHPEARVRLEAAQRRQRAGP